MATRGFATVLGTDRDGHWRVKPDLSALDVLRKAATYGQPVEIRAVKEPKAPKLKLRA